MSKKSNLTTSVSTVKAGVSLGTSSVTAPIISSGSTQLKPPAKPSSRKQ